MLTEISLTFIFTVDKLYGDSLLDDLEAVIHKCIIINSFIYHKICMC